MMEGNNLQKKKYIQNSSIIEDSRPSILISKIKITNEVKHNL